MATCFATATINLHRAYGCKSTLGLGPFLVNCAEDEDDDGTNGDLTLRPEAMSSSDSRRRRECVSASASVQTASEPRAPRFFVFLDPTLDFLLLDD